MLSTIRLLKSELRISYKLFRNLIKGQKKIQTSASLLKIGRKGFDSFFGYYDISPFNEKDEVLYIEVSKHRKEADICCYSINNKSSVILSKSYAWNWQQGSRLRWFPGSNDLITFNDFKDGKYYNRILNIRDGKERILDNPVYDWNFDGSQALTLDFARLGVLRPGYGYTCDSYTAGDLSNNGIGLIDGVTGKLQRIISYKEISVALNNTSDFDNCYINHLSFSPSGEKFLFFWIEIINGYHKASLAVFDIDKDNVIPLERIEKVSHYVWQDDDTIVCTSYSTPRDCRYFVYHINSRTKEQICPKVLNRDGHPSFYRDGILLTDTYPDVNYFQHLMMVDINKDVFKPILEIYSNPRFNGEKRTDLHPRFNSDKSFISIDAHVAGKRKMYILNKF